MEEKTSKTENVDQSRRLYWKPKKKRKVSNQGIIQRSSQIFCQNHYFASAFDVSSNL